MKGAVDVVGADVGDRLDGDEFGVQRAQQHTALVAGADHAHAHRLVELLRVVVVHRPEAVARGHFGLDALHQELAPHVLAADGGVEVHLPDYFVFGTQIHRRLLL